VSSLRLRLSAFDRDGFTVFLEPEGAAHRVQEGGVTIDFPEGTQAVEVSWTPEGLSVMRDGEARGYPLVHDAGGEVLDW
jgi:hypothetical protein